MRRARQTTILGTAALLLLAACVSSRDVPPVGVVPAPTPSPPAAPSPLVATPQALNLSLSAIVPPYPTLTVSQAAATGPPFIVAVQSTCLADGYVALIGTSQSGSAATFALQALRTGSCVFVFESLSGASLIVPVTITP
jgi:hypothetical protein